MWEFSSFREIVVSSAFIDYAKRDISPLKDRAFWLDGKVKAFVIQTFKTTPSISTKIYKI